MSRNHNIRAMAAKLPPFPKLKGRKVQRDGAGNIIYVDHFRELKDIQRRHMDAGKSAKDPAIFAEQAQYFKMVMAYDKFRKRKQITWAAAIAVAIVAAVAIHFLRIYLS